VTAAGKQQFTLLTLTAMVVGSMVGAGIFSLPRTFGQATGPFGAMIAWTIAGSGMLMLALTFQSLAQRKPELDSGIFAYAKEGFGDYLGFVSALGYWTVCCLGNVSYFVLVKSTLGAIFPALGEGNTVKAVLISSCILWGVHFLILRGVREAAGVNTIVTIAKLIPIVIFIALVSVVFDAKLFTASFWGGEELSFGGVFNQVRATMLVTVFVFIGVEGASVYSRYARKRSHVGLATLLGFGGVLALMVLITLLSYGVLPREDLAGLRQPSMAGVLQAAVGGWGAVFVSAGLIISVMGAYLAWSLLAAEVLFSAARNDDMPRVLAYENRNKTPANALLLTNLFVQLCLVLTLFSEDAFFIVLKLTGSMALIPYFLVSAYALKLAWTGETYGGPAEPRRAHLVRAGLAVVYTAFLVFAGGLKFVLLSALIYAPGTALYVWARKEQGKRVFRPMESLLFALAVLACLVGIIGLATGYIII
jgi:arginine:ornithine antiporter / lysine permease